VLSARASAWADFDNNGFLDVIIGGDFGVPVFVFLNEGGTFVAQKTTGLFNEVPNFTRGLTTIDFNNDGRMDILAIDAKDETPAIFENLGDTTFARLSRDRIPFVSNLNFASTPAVADYDGDGRQDFFVGAGFGSTDRNRLYRNTFEELEGENNWIRINLDGVVSNKNGIGAQIEVIRTGDPVIFTQVTATEGTWSGNEITAHLGLGETPTIDTLRVYWPSGGVSVLTDVDTDTLTVSEADLLESIDREALTEFYLNSGGPNWTNNENWLSNDPLGEWFGVETNVDGLVQSVRLPANNLPDTVSGDILGLSVAEVIDLSNNDIKFFTSLTGIKQSLDTLDVRNNRLGFGNIAFPSQREAFVFDPQLPLNDGREVFIRATESGSFTAGDPFAGNVYSWRKDGQRITAAGVRVSGNTVFITNASRSQRGEYTATITNPRVPGFALQSGPIEFIPFASVEGQLSAFEDTIAAGAVFAYELVPVTGEDGVTRTTFDTVAVSNLFPIEDASQGGRSFRQFADALTYRFDTLALGDYTFLGIRFRGEEFQSLEFPKDTIVVADSAIFTTDTTFLATYLGTVDTIRVTRWQDSRRIQLNNDRAGLNIVLEPFPDVAPGVGDGFVTGIVETEDGIEDPSGRSGKVLRRRRVRRTSVQLRRRFASRREEQGTVPVLIAITNTNDNGEYRFENLDPGEYQVLVEVPGFSNPVPDDSVETFRVNPQRAGANVSQVLDLPTQTIETEIEIILGTPEVVMGSETRVYPNPAVNRVFIPLEAMEEPQRMKLYDLNGNLLYEQMITAEDLKAGRTTMSLPRVQDGTYLIQVEGARGKGIYSTRLMIRK
jgi:hypothetical protein